MALTKATYSMISGAPVNVLDYGAKGDGTTDDTAAFQAALTSSQTTNAAIFVPQGNYVISSPLIFNASTKDAVIYGQSKYDTQIIYKGTSGYALSITSNTCVLENFSLLSNAGSSATCSGIIIIGANRPLINSIMVNSLTGTDRWQGAMLLFQGLENEANIVNCHFLGITSADSGLNGIAFIPGAKSVAHQITNTIIYNCSSAILVNTTTNPGVEGLKINGGEFVAVAHGIYAINSSSYTPPLIDLNNLHINSTAEAVYVQGYQSLFVNNCLFYSVGNSFFYLSNLTNLTVSGVQMIAPSAGPTNQCAFIFAGTSDAAVNIQSCLFQPYGSSNTGSFVYFGSGSNPFAVTLLGNQSNINNWTTSYDVFLGNVFPTLLTYANNTPKVGNDISATVNLSGTTLTVSNTRSEIVVLGSVTGSSVINTITGNSDGRVLTIQSNTFGVTLTNSSTILLKGGTNMVFSAGGLITLVNLLNGSWQEISRSN
jgi:polygalacturonase